MTVGVSSPLPTALSLPALLCEALIARAQAARSREICGFLAMDVDTPATIDDYPIANRAPDACQRFEMDPAEQIAAFKDMRARRQRMLAIYHSHPTTAAVPSIHDRAGHSYPGAAALIISPAARAPDQLRAWAIDARIARPIALYRSPAPNGEANLL